MVQFSNIYFLCCTLRQTKGRCLLCVEFVPHKQTFIIHFQIPVAGALLDEGRERSGGADDERLDGRPRHRVRFASSSIHVFLLFLCLCIFHIASWPSRKRLTTETTFSGLLVAQQSISRPPLLVAQMTEEWLNYYRKIAQSSNPAQSRAGGQNNSMINW